MGDPEPPLSRLFAETERNLASLRTGGFTHSSPPHSSHALSQIHSPHRFTEHKESMPLPSPPLAPPSALRSAPPSSTLPPAPLSSMSDADCKLEAFTLLLSSLRTSLRTDLSLLSSSLHQKTSSLRSQFIEFTEEAVRDVEERVRAKWEGREADRDVELNGWKTAVDEDIRDLHHTVDDSQYHLRMKREEVDRTVKALEKALRETKVRVEAIEKRRGDNQLGKGGGSEGPGVEREVKRLRDEVQVMASHHTADVVEVRREVEERWLSQHTLLHDLRGVVDVLMSKEEKEWERRRDEREERKTSLTADLQAAVKAEVTELWTALRDTKRRTLTTEDHMKESERRLEDIEGKVAQQGTSLHMQGSGRRVGGAGEVEALERRSEERWAERDRTEQVRAEGEERRWEDRLERLRLRMEKDWATKLRTQQLELDELRLQVQKGANVRGVAGKSNGGGEWDEGDDGTDVRPSLGDVNSAGNGHQGGVSRVVVRLNERVDGLEEQLRAVEAECQRDIREAQSAWVTQQADKRENEDEERQRLQTMEGHQKEVSELKRRQGEVEVSVRTLTERVRRAEEVAADERTSQHQRLEEERQAMVERLRQLQAEVAECVRQQQIDRTTQQPRADAATAADVEVALTKIAAMESRVSTMDQRLTQSNSQHEAAHTELRQQQLNHTREADGRTGLHNALEGQISTLHATVTELTSRMQTMERQTRDTAADLTTGQASIPPPPSAATPRPLPPPALPQQQPHLSSPQLKAEAPAIGGSLTTASAQSFASTRSLGVLQPNAQPPTSAKAQLLKSTSHDEGNDEWNEEVEEELELEVDEEQEEAAESSSSEEEEEPRASDKFAERERAQSTQREQEQAREKAKAEAERLKAAEEQQARVERDRVERERAELFEEKRLQAERLEAEKKRLKAEEEERLHAAKARKEKEEERERKRRLEEAALKKKREEEAAEEETQRKAAAAEEQRRLSVKAEQLRVSAAAEEEATRQRLSQSSRPLPSTSAAAETEAKQQHITATSSAKSVPPAVIPPPRRPPLSALANRSDVDSSSDESEEDNEVATAARAAPRGPTTRPASGSQGQQLPSMLQPVRRSGLVSALSTRPSSYGGSASSSPALSSASPSPSLTHMPSLTTGYRPSVSGAAVSAGATARYVAATASSPAAAEAASPKDDLDDFDLDLEVDDFLDSSKGDNDFYID